MRIHITSWNSEDDDLIERYPILSKMKPELIGGSVFIELADLQDLLWLRKTILEDITIEMEEHDAFVLRILDDHE